MSPGYCNEYVHVFLAGELTPGQARPEADERIELKRRPLAEALCLVESGEIRDAKSILGLLLAERRLKGSPTQ